MVGFAQVEMEDPGLTLTNVRIFWLDFLMAMEGEVDL